MKLDSRGLHDQSALAADINVVSAQRAGNLPRLATLTTKFLTLETARATVSFGHSLPLIFLPDYILQTADPFSSYRRPVASTSATHTLFTCLRSTHVHQEKGNTHICERHRNGIAG